MNVLVLSLLFAAVAADGATSAENPLLTELLQKGVTAADGSTVKLPPPILSDDMDAAAQTKAIARLVPTNSTLEQFFQKSSSAKYYWKIRKIPCGDETFRGIDLGFVAHGSWQTLTSKKFSESIFKTKKQQNEQKGQTISKLGFLTPEETETRKLKSHAADGQEERYFYTTFILFDVVEVSATRHAVLTKTPSSIVLATRVDPRFAADAEYPNQWREVTRDVTANLVFGKPQPYVGAGFYAKLTRLKTPDDTIFIEYHSTFLEPNGWFQGENTLRAKLPVIAAHEVQEFRGKLARATLDAAETGDKAKQ